MFLLKVTLKLFHLCIFQVEETSEPDVADTPVGLLAVVSENSTDMIQFDLTSVAIVVEDELALPDWPYHMD